MNASINHVPRLGAESGEVPGVVAAFGKRPLGEPADVMVDTVARIASMAKGQTATTAMQLIEQGGDLAQIERPARKQLPSKANTNAVSR